MNRIERRDYMPRTGISNSRRLTFSVDTQRLTDSQSDLPDDCLGMFFLYSQRQATPLRFPASEQVVSPSMTA